MHKTLPKDLTSYDLLKTYAVVLMILDHVGYYFFPEENWFRVFGRLCVPAWFFLIGYAQSRDISPRLWIGAALLMGGDVIAGMYIFPLNILATMLVIRLLLDTVMARMMLGKSQFWAIYTILFLLVLPSGMWFEYGTLGLILAIFGFIIRRRDALKDEHRDLPQTYLLAALATFVGYQAFTFGFNQVQANTLFVGTLAVLAALYFFRPETYPRLTAGLPAPVVWLLHLTGRRTLEIYVIHLLMFKMTGLFNDPARFSLFDVRLFY